jgi:Bromodomain
MAPFEKPVSLAAYPDYMQYVDNPMDLQSVERKVKNAVYTTPEDFEYDVLLIFNNCIAYNAARKSDHLVAMGKYGIKQFKKIFVAKIRALDDPVGAAAAAKESQRKSAPGVATQGPAKKMKVDSPGGSVASVANAVVGLSRGKSAPRISLTAAQVSSATTDKVALPSRAKPVVPSAKPKDVSPKSSAPVPLHIAIARVKEAFPLRRAVKSLQSWEANCARFFKELMRHSWISAARPKFIFHVPVPVLFPVSDLI